MERELSWKGILEELGQPTEGIWYWKEYHDTGIPKKSDKCIWQSHNELLCWRSERAWSEWLHITAKRRRLEINFDDIQFKIWCFRDQWRWLAWKWQIGISRNLNYYQDKREVCGSPTKVMPSSEESQVVAGVRQKKKPLHNQLGLLKAPDLVELCSRVHRMSVFRVQGMMWEFG